MMTMMILKTPWLLLLGLFSANAYIAEDIEGMGDYYVWKGVRCDSRKLPTGSGTIGNTTDDEYPVLEGLHVNCPDGFFCDLTDQVDPFGVEYVLGLCKPCQGSPETCEFSPFSANNTVIQTAMAEECNEQCGVEKNSCSLTSPCAANMFCDIPEGQETGFCQGCPRHLYYCTDVAFSEAAVTDCEAKCDLNCQPDSYIALTDFGAEEELPEPITTFMPDVNTMTGAPQLKASGRIVDCGLGLEPCEDAQGAVCLIQRGKAPFFNKTINCFEGGGVAAIIYNVEASCDNIAGTLSGQQVYIPSVSLSYTDGIDVLAKLKSMPPERPLVASVEIRGPDNNCWMTCTKDNECKLPGTTCNFDNVEFGDCKEQEFRPPCNDAASFDTDFLPCTVEGEFCDFSMGKRGFCMPCPERDAECFFSNLNGLGAKECARSCMSSYQQELESAPCKFCPRGSFAIGDIGEGFVSSVSEEVENPCEFCAATTTSTCSGSDRWDMKYPDRTIQMFGASTECWAVAELYRSLNIAADSAACDSARFFNYICGCSDSMGYAGADTDKKQALLVWLPRIGSILSIFGSSFMIIGVMRDEQKRKKVIGELIIFLCIFDIIGSIGYAFTSYTTPQNDYIYGSAGNEATCTAQGFFIQIGTIAMYINVSIAFYYLLIIQYSWREHRLRKSRLYHALFIVPVVIGCIFAFAGIPFYDNVILWCNNSRNYWSEIPVMIGIAIATVVMVNLCWFVWKSERASKRFRRHSENERASLSKSFFMQALVYLGSFYLTWPPYLALQLMIARGRAFSYYGFYLFAGTAVTLQGFWNFVFHTGMHTKAIGKQIREVWTTVVTGRSTRGGGGTSFFLSRSMVPGKTDAEGVTGNNKSQKMDAPEASKESDENGNSKTSRASDGSMGRSSAFGPGTTKSSAMMSNSSEVVL